MGDLTRVLTIVLSASTLGVITAVGGLILQWRRYPIQRRLDERAAADASNQARVEVAKLAEEVAAKLLQEMRAEMEAQDKRHADEITDLRERIERSEARARRAEQERDQALAHAWVLDQREDGDPKPPWPESLPHPFDSLSPRTIRTDPKT